MKRIAASAALVAWGCNEPAFHPVAAPEVPVIEDPWDVCDAGDAAWVQRTLPLVWGRQPHGAAEVQIWVAAVEAAGRPAVLDALTRDPAYLDHQTDVWMDALHVPRTGGRVDYSCWAGPLLEDDSGALAAFLTRASPADATDAIYNMADVMRSALQHDDLSVVYRTALFARLHKPVSGANVGPIELEENRRTDFGDEFFDVWLRRDLDCVPCHNSAFSSTDHPDPELDRSGMCPASSNKPCSGSMPESRPTARMPCSATKQWWKRPVRPSPPSGCRAAARSSRRAAMAATCSATTRFSSPHSAQRVRYGTSKRRSTPE